MEKSFKNFKDYEITILPKDSGLKELLKQKNISEFLELIEGVNEECYYLRNGLSSPLIGIDLGNGFLLGLNQYGRRNSYDFFTGLGLSYVQDNDIKRPTITKFNKTRFNKVISLYRDAFDRLMMNRPLLEEIYNNIINYNAEGYYLTDYYKANKYTQFGMTSKTQPIALNEGSGLIKYNKIVDASGFISFEIIELLNTGVIPTLKQMSELTKDFLKPHINVYFTYIKNSFKIEIEGVTYEFDKLNSLYYINGEYKRKSTFVDSFDLATFEKFKKEFHHYSRDLNDKIIEGFRKDFLEA